MIHFESTRSKAYATAPTDVGTRNVFINGLAMKSSIGVHEFERKTEQRVKVSVQLAVSDESRTTTDTLEDVVCYDKIVTKMKMTIKSRHFNLVETLAEHLAYVCMEDLRVRFARVKVEKLDVYCDIDSVGVEICRGR